MRIERLIAELQRFNPEREVNFYLEQSEMLEDNSTLLLLELADIKNSKKELKLIFAEDSYNN